jgi:pimeloyl-ACP methyl ester carboxylesterase
MDRDLCNFVNLKHGGRLAFAEYGHAEGTPVFFFHGWPSSRTMAELTDRSARELGLRIISPDRPGIRDSTFQPNRKLLDWPETFERLADHLNLDRVYILAVSGGAPYAFAVGWKLPQRICAIAIVSGAPPIAELQDRQGLLAIYRLMLHCHQKYPRLSRAGFHLARPFLSLRPPKLARPLFLKSLRMRPWDADALRDSAAFEACFESQRLAWKASTVGVLADAEIYAQPWGFRLEDVKVPVRLWHGKGDRAFSLHLAEQVATRLPNCRARFIDNEGHYSLPIRHVRQILADLVTQ